MVKFRDRSGGGVIKSWEGEIYLVGSVSVGVSVEGSGNVDEDPLHTAQMHVTPPAESS